MSVWAKLVTAIKGGANEAAEAIVDTQVLRILDQEIRDAENEINMSERGLTTIIAKQKLSQNKINDLIASISEHEGYAKQALNQGNEDLALEIADKIADLERQNEVEREFLNQFSTSSGSLRNAIQETKKNMLRMKHQVDTVKATQSVQQAQTALASRHLGANSRMKTASESLERIKEKQAQRAAEIEAANDSSGDNLQDKLKLAGIAGSPSSKAILARLRSSKQINFDANN